jgi:hypothetical protein
VSLSRNDGQEEADFKRENKVTRMWKAFVVSVRAAACPKYIRFIPAAIKHTYV